MVIECVITNRRSNKFCRPEKDSRHRSASSQQIVERSLWRLLLLLLSGGDLALELLE